MARTPTGIVTPTGLAIVHRGVTVPLPATLTPLGQAVAELCADIEAGLIVACPHCGEYGGCECEDWIEWMATAEHAPLDVMTDEDLPY